MNREILNETKWWNRYLGLDCSSKAIHGIILNQKGKLIYKFRTKKIVSVFDERFLKIIENFAEELGKIKVVKTFVEAAIYIQNPKSTIEIARVVGGVQLVCYDKNITCNLVDNTKWKKEIVGKGNCSKADIMSFAINK